MWILCRFLLQSTRWFGWLRKTYIETSTEGNQHSVHESRALILSKGSFRTLNRLIVRYGTISPPTFLVYLLTHVTPWYYFEKTTGQSLATYYFKTAKSWYVLLLLDILSEAFLLTLSSSGEWFILKLYETSVQINVWHISSNKTQIHYIVNNNSLT